MYDMQVHLVEKIGSGAFGSVFRGHVLPDGTTVAVKTISKHRSTPAQLDRLKREMEACKALRHRNIIKVHEVTEMEDEIRIIMDHAQGGDFLNLVNSGNLSEKDARNFILQLINTLQYVNSQGWVHLDVKLENLLLKDDMLFLCDWGMSLYAPLPAPLPAHSTGSLWYAAPELLSPNAMVTTKCDVYSAGVVLYAMLYGRLPCQAKTVSEMRMLFAAQDLDFPPIASPLCIDLMRKMLEIDPHDRIDVNEVLSHLWFFKNINIPASSTLRKSTGMICSAEPHRGSSESLVGYCGSSTSALRKSAGLIDVDCRQREPRRDSSEIAIEA